MTDYQVVTANGPNDSVAMKKLAEEVKKEIQKDWTPQGGVTYCLVSNGSVNAYQAMTK